MRMDEYCKVLCQTKLNAHNILQFKRSIDEWYHHNWIVDNSPAARVIDTESFVTTSYSRGFPVGYYDRVSGALENHANIVIEYHEAVPVNGMVGFYVEPFSCNMNLWCVLGWQGYDTSSADMFDGGTHGSESGERSCIGANKIDRGAVYV